MTDQPTPDARLRSSGSLRRRLALQLVGSAAVLASLLFFAVLGFTRDVSQRSHDSILLASATSLMDSVTIEEGQVTLDIPYAALSMLGNISDDRVFYRVTLDDSTLTGYGDLPEAPAGARLEEPGYWTGSYRGAGLRSVTLRRRMSLDSGAAGIAITVAQTREGQQAELAALTRSALALGGGFFAIAALLALWTAQSSIRPLQVLTGVVSRRGPKDLRPVQRAVPSEMLPLVHSLNRFIERLRVSLTRSEEFIAEAAHRVRTPLATVRTQAEITLRRVEKPENRNSLREMIRAIDESSRAAGQLLDHAMVTFRTDSLERKPVDLQALAEELVGRLRPVAELKDIALVLEAGSVPPVPGDAILIQNALRNILDNAIKYAPPDSEVAISVTMDQSAVTIAVTDEAGGFPEAEKNALTERFVRGSNAAGTIGSGLGLTIAREVAEAHGGRLVLSTSSTGAGACVSLSFPLS
ncbi:sensor histidine kinase [Roseobacter sp. SK209-2-6]|uniref:sensor histidine kinase n=1 Tax=Roseobacter sp. SK209-2-6 TaxID=388739 RepID=UPI0000F3D66C|nr:sensor histidine kinase [Roseobacter sp. SK209-2-6]EBA15702.1 sensor histidine kinase [Roseobacter sp. SK209-2-6]